MVSHLLLAENNLGDDGVSELRDVIANSSTLVSVDLAMNNISPKCAYDLRHIMAKNCSIFSFNIGSYPGAQRNRIGKEGAFAIAAGFRSGNSLV